MPPAHSGKKKGVSDLHRTATTSGRCYLPVLTELRGSWSCRTYPISSNEKGPSIIPHEPVSSMWSYGDSNPGPLACHASALAS